MASPAATPFAPTTDKPPRRRRWIPLSLRLFVAMLGLVCVIGALWMGVRVYRRQVVIREIQQANGTVEFESDAPSWLYQWMNDDWLSAFDRISDVTLPFSETLDANTKHLVAMRPLPRLQIEGGPPVHELIRNGRLDEVRLILARHRILLFSCDSELVPGRTLLHVAVCEREFDIRQRAEIVRFLLEQGAEIDALDFFGFTPLSSAGDPAIVKLLLDHGADMKLDVPSSRVLDAAADSFTRCDAEHQEKWLEIAKLLRAAGAECDIVSACCLNDLPRVRQLLRPGRPAQIQEALRAAATWGRTDIAKVLLAAGADPNDVHHDKPVVFDAIRHPNVLRIFFDHGIDAGVSYKHSGIEGWTLLHEAAGQGAVDSAQLVLNHRIPVDSRDADGQTPLHVAAMSGKAAVVKLLLDHHAHVNAQTGSGTTAISYAASDFRWWGSSRAKINRAARREVIELLLAAGAQQDLFTAIALGRPDVARDLLAEQPELTHSKDCQENSPLNRAVNLDQPEIVQALLAAGADIDAGGDYEEATPLHRAARLGLSAITKILIEHEADVNKTDAYGLTPLHWAAGELKPQVVRLLLEAGAKPDARDENHQTPLDHARAPRLNKLTEAEQEKLAEIIKLLSEREESAGR
jgi:ankyrin repeat protein